MSKDTHGASGRGWIGVDLDGTLAHYDGWVGPAHIGDPIPAMLKRVKRWLEQNIEVRIVTARVSPGKDDAYECRRAIDAWLDKHVGKLLEVTHEKDHFMLELWDDRCVQVVPNTGARADLVSPMRVDAIEKVIGGIRDSLSRGDTESILHSLKQIEIQLEFMKGNE